ncbi:MAG: GNAT family N-acetyltransferase [Candidatus Omnitrophica bacterium]|nr:GNAT family N-acetyltransferase [Candidatus Omnitrophota bacterium]MDD5352390.1 GNAT family N-acetyltransferase [Candidatus Omnitrophota bacterium]MDD5549988.1 GNAT family N-acetyltransferase [Candidatus Omnitrophota bacterium]
MKLKLRRAREEDCRDMWLWRNAPQIRKNFFNMKIISWDTHKKWFYSRINSPRTHIYIACSGKDKIGLIRFDSNSDYISVSVNLNPVFLGKGLGTRIIKLGTQKILHGKKETNKPIIAKIKNDNIISQKAFFKAGYKLFKKTKDRTIYKK